ncbi:ligase-associated DNA damage response DEXH box helicase [Synechococcus sp. RSCCF101]|uniref:ligase-associated DNA damage response DEXH box helicase n=1 Tax=Synechococcus sp. RSCCF101 TaxID=2511069 RepID=UPI001246F51F|nr:ligase-associated DNA damage response DEXH box helicase [Synechococcus sp. RSCCF101]QEY33372.1 ligase-associated DNA damage response DEXH box helicase [Synechococcus sp. RSCCF101]
MRADAEAGAADPRLGPIEAWFATRGWTPMPFQRRAWQAELAGREGLIQVPTGSGKTYAAVMGPIASMLADDPARPGLRLVYLTPLRALSRDLALAIREPIEAMGWPLRVAIRNGDTSSSQRSRQLSSPPHILITTPESLSLLLANPRAEQLFAGLESVILDEWHELLGSKRGIQCELCLSWLRQQRPQLRTWAISATIGNLEEAARHALGLGSEPVLIGGAPERATEIRSLLPESIDGFPWAGHLGLRMYEELVGALRPDVSTLLFTNTRNQSERWQQCLRFACPEMEDQLALHHSAIDRGEREAIEAGVKNGSIRWVVCTSSLDLGVDFQPVQQVVQIGSPKNLARLLQRAGRSAHTPGGTSQVLFMPTNALELLEVSAVRRGLAEGLVEERRPPQAPLDVLLQHLTSLACGPGFEPGPALAAVRRSWSYRHLSDAEWVWALEFLESGGACLAAYPRYRKLERQRDGGGAERLRVREQAIARLHRLNIGTITAAPAITVRFVRGSVLGHVEETFIGQLKPGDVFFFAGRQLEFVRLRDMTAHVKSSTRRTRTVPAWAGGQMALSSLLTEHLRREVDRAARGELDTPELQALAPLLERQQDLSRLPRLGELLIETCRTREGVHLYAYPFEGRFVHEGLGFLWSARLTRLERGTLTVSVNDYGFELLAPRGYPMAELVESALEDLLDPGSLESDLEQALNLSELCRRRFRAIAQIAGLIQSGYPGQNRSAGQLQISSALLFDVFQRHEPGNRLLAQARREVLEEQLELPRLREALGRLGRCTVRHERTPRPGPLAFPLLVERLNNRMSNESVLERVQRLMAEAQRAEA